jgi:hypothetical protein
MAALKQQELAVARLTVSLKLSAESAARDTKEKDDLVEGFGALYLDED